jgi:hypothetical protein
MAKRTDPSARRRLPLQRVIVSEEDVAAARKVLQALAGGGEPVDGRSDHQSLAGRAPDRTELVRRAREACAFRERRLRVFSFSAEPPFVLLLALYANEEWEPTMTLTRLIGVAWLTMSTTLRWLDVLVSEDWVQRRNDPDDARKTLLSLSDAGRALLDTFFSEEPSRAP